MTSQQRRPAWPALILAGLGLTILYAQPLGTGFLNDDYLLLEEVRSRPLLETVSHLGPLGNYYRPLSRQIYFELLTPIAGGHPVVFHVANYLIFLASLALLADLLRVFLSPAGVMAGCLYFAVLPLQRVNLIWVSCSQDLLALALSLASLALFRRGRSWEALIAYGSALASKEAALPLPVALLTWEAWVESRGLRRAAARTTPFFALGLVWLGVAQRVGVFHAARPWLHFRLDHFLAAFVHMAQSLVGLEQPTGMVHALLEYGPPLIPLVLLAALALWYSAATRATAEYSKRPGGGAMLGFAGTWLLAYGVVTGPVASTWSAYYYTLAAVGGALLVGFLLRRGDQWTWLILVAFLLWWQAGTSNVRSFAVADRPWGWTSHLTSFYFQRASALADRMSRELRALEPAPPRGARFFFATLPPWAGFQMGNGALVRALYRDVHAIHREPTLGSFFYSQFSETTAADRPCRFFYWDGAQLERLYPNARDLSFQVGSDLLLLDRPAGAAHAFRRGIAAGGNRMDLLYWLGWAELWQGDRAAAEATWKAFGAVDDSLYWSAHLRAAHNALGDRDTLNARRHLIRAIEFGIGRPEAHEVLGELLAAERPKYAMLELKVATWLKPSDWMAHRSLALGLVGARLDEAAHRELETLAELYPEWRSDSLVARARRALERRTAAGLTVARF